jgi:VCBS repeat protein
MIVLCVRWCLRFSPSIRDLEDLISDGLLDLAVCTNSGSTYDSSLYFYAGMGNGEFQPPVLITAGPTSVAAGDLNGDGLPDLAGANPNNSGSIQVYLSNGNGTFQPQSNYSLATHNDPLNNELSIAIADVNKDGQPDIVNGTYQYPGVLDGGLVTVLPGNGDGAFGATITSLQGEEVSTMTLADFDGDGYPDVAFVGYNNAVSVALNNGTGKFESAVYQVAQYARTVLVGKFQGTSRLDLALLDSPNLRLYPGAANGTFGQPLSSTALGNVAATADLNGDGIPDVAVAGSNADQVQVFFGQTEGNFRAGPIVRLSQHISSITAADFNGDGIPDIAFGTTAEGSNPSGIQVWLGDGTGNFTVTYTAAVPKSNLTQIVAADFNGDGKQDLAVTDVSSSTVFGLFLGNGNGTFQQLTRFGSGTLGTRRLTTGDFNGDGNLDVAASDASLGFIYVMLGNGSGGFQSAATLNWVLAAGSLATGDFNCDGHLDLAAGTGNQVSFFAGNGDGAFGAPSVFGAGSENYGLAIGDFNGDGKPDAATANFEGRSMSVLINTTRCEPN